MNCNMSPVNPCSLLHKRLRDKCLGRCEACVVDDEVVARLDGTADKLNQPLEVRQRGVAVVQLLQGADLDCQNARLPTYREIHPMTVARQLSQA